jgi:hypothetical protein
MGKVTQALLAYGAFVISYLLAGIAFYQTMRALTPPRPTYTCVDSCFAGAEALIADSAGETVLTVSLMVALMKLTAAWDADRLPRSGLVLVGVALRVAVSVCAGSSGHWSHLSPCSAPWVP